MHVVAAIVAAIVLALTAAGPAAAATRYIVAPHDTLFSIARRFHVPLLALAQVNGIHDLSRIRVGDVLIIPDAASAPAASPASVPVVSSAPSASPAPAASPASAMSSAPAVPPVSAPDGLAQQMRSPIPSRLGPSAQTSTSVPAVAAVSYIVRPGDTLYHLAVTHGTTVDALETANGLTSPAIVVGQVLRLPRSAEPAPALTPLLTPAPVPPVDTAPSDPSGPSLSGPNVPATPEPALRSGPRIALLGQVRASALRYLGTPYVWGGTTPAGVDCSGLVYLIYSPYVASLPRTSYDQWTAGVAVDRTDLAVGDLVFFNTDGSGASHVGIYIGGGEFVHPAASAQRVVVDRLDAPYYATHYLGARRIL